MVLQEKAQPQSKLITVDEYWELVNLPENRDKRLELVGGVLIEVAPSSTTNTIIAAWFTTFMNIYLLDHPIGYVSAPDGGFKMINGNIRQPDAAFISKARYPKPGDKVFPIAPDIAVEVISASESAKEVRDKVHEYLQSGTIFVWVAYPETRSIDVCSLNPDGTMTIRTLNPGDSLGGGDVLPGFSVLIDKFFPTEEA
ncbi:MAG TPA: Uma2 family endonuclease [Phototrophicaceae bacterium]|jgi:Uma2 family endonuclease|nr:Uma2 family endonuclease [Phototrophicaceae bacterium]